MRGKLSVYLLLLFLNCFSSGCYAHAGAIGACWTLVTIPVKACYYIGRFGWRYPKTTSAIAVLAYAASKSSVRRVLANAWNAYDDQMLRRVGNKLCDRYIDYVFYGDRPQNCISHPVQHVIGCASDEIVLPMFGGEEQARTIRLSEMTCPITQASFAEARGVFRFAVVISCHQGCDYHNYYSADGLNSYILDKIEQNAGGDIVCPLTRAPITQIIVYHVDIDAQGHVRGACCCEGVYAPPFRLRAI
jgi:hypothetical protein